MFETFEHKADIGIRGLGKTIEEAFCNTAKAMFSIMVDLNKVEPKVEVKISTNAASIEELLVYWLNELLSEALAKNIIFCDFKASIRETANGFVIESVARGEKIEPEKHELKTEVKGATFSELKVERKNSKWLVQCVVDV